jgi:hypothetical protein
MYLAIRHTPAFTRTHKHRRHPGQVQSESMRQPYIVGSPAAFRILLSPLSLLRVVSSHLQLTVM